MNTTSDNGGVHINSGIPNRAIHLTATEIGGNAWEKAGYISYITLTERLRENSNFQEAALMTSEVASSIYGQGAREQKAVQNAWALVGIATK